MASDAFGLYTSEPVRNTWLTYLEEYKDATGKTMSSSGKANFHVAVVKFLKWIDDATGPVVALGHHLLNPTDALSLSKVIRFWEGLQKRTFKLAKDEGIKNNTTEKLASSMPFGQLFKMRCIMQDTVEPALRDLTVTGQQRDLKLDELVLYFNLLMYALMLTRTCRPSTYAAWYAVENSG